MQTLKHYLLLFSALICSSVYVNAQYDNYNADYTDIYPGRRIFIDYNERFSTAKYKGRNTSYTTPDGTQVEVKSYGRTSTVEVFERPPLPSIHIIYKEFFANGKLKQMGVFLPMQLKIGKWFESDEQGNGFIVDYEAGRNIYGYNKMLEYLQQKGYYYASDSQQYKFTFWHTPESHRWGVRVDRYGQPIKTFTFDSTGQGDIEEMDMDTSVPSVPVYGTFVQDPE